MICSEDYRKRNVWCLEMGPRESKIKPIPKPPTRPDCGGGITPVTSYHDMSMTRMQSSNPKPVTVCPENSMRWQSLYDVYICHSKEDADCCYAMDLLTYLEQQPEKLRCFLPMRDMLVGSPIPSELCSGVENSHCWVMLLTPHFLSDNWCKYQMHQFLAQAPCSNGRLIPVVIGLTFAQYPMELKYMYAFKGTLNDKSVFFKVKEAILTYLKEMLNVTSDQIPSHSPNSRIPESSPSTSKTEGKGEVENSMTQETMHNRSISSVAQETTSDMAIRSPTTQELATGMTSKSPVIQERNREVPLKNLETSIYRSTSNSVTQETTSDMSSRNSVSQETTSEVSLRSLVSEETTSAMAMKSSVTRLKTNSLATCDTSMRSSQTPQETTSDVSIRSSLTGQETTSDVSMRSSITGEETTIDLSMRSSLTRQETTSDVSMRNSITGQETISDVFIGRSLTGKETTSDVSMRSSITGQETMSDVFIGRSLTGKETTSDVSMRSSLARQETTSDVSMRSYGPGLDSPYCQQDKNNALSLSPQLINTRDVCKDCKCIMAATKDSFSQETRIDTSDSGVWSMTMDLHADCSDLHTCGVQTASKYSHSDSSEFYTNCIDVHTGQKDSHPQAMSTDSDVLYSNGYTSIPGQNSATCPEEHDCLPNR